MSMVLLNLQIAALRVTGFTEEDIKSKQVGMFSMSTKDDLAKMYQRAGELLSGERQFMFSVKPVECQAIYRQFLMFPCLS